MPTDVEHENGLDTDISSSRAPVIYKNIPGEGGTCPLYLITSRKAGCNIFLILTDVNVAEHVGNQHDTECQVSVKYLHPSFNWNLLCEKITFLFDASKLNSITKSILTALRLS